MPQVPVIFQLTSTDCGAACLAMILNYFDHRVSVEECAQICGGSWPGGTAKAIAQAARHYKLDVRGYFLETADFTAIQLPAIAHWKSNHYVVVEEWTPTSISIVDPGIGRRRLTAAEFAAGFSAVILTFKLAESDDTDGHAPEGNPKLP